MRINLAFFHRRAEGAPPKEPPSPLETSPLKFGLKTIEICITIDFAPPPPKKIQEESQQPHQAFVSLETVKEERSRDSRLKTPPAWVFSLWKWFTRGPKAWYVFSYFSVVLFLIERNIEITTYSCLLAFSEDFFKGVKTYCSANFFVTLIFRLFWTKYIYN